MGHADKYWESATYQSQRVEMLARPLHSVEHTRHCWGCTFDDQSTVSDFRYYHNAHFAVGRCYKRCLLINESIGTDGYASVNLKRR